MRSARLRLLISVTATAVIGVLAFAPTSTALAAPAAHSTGFSPPFSGAPAFEYVAPTQLTSAAQLNVAIGPQRAARIAAQIGLGPSDALLDWQYRALVSGGGVGGRADAARIIDACVRILTNTVGRPMYATVNGNRTPTVLASYGLYVNSSGMLMSPANAAAPTRQVNTLLAPGGFVGTWMRSNGAARSLAALYRSAYTVQVPFGFAAQQTSGAAQLVTNTKRGTSVQVGMSMAPPLWIVNFALLYILKPALAAAMPAYWAPIPPAVARAVHVSPNGQIRYADVAAMLD